MAVLFAYRSSRMRNGFRNYNVYIYFTGDVFMTGCVRTILVCFAGCCWRITPLGDYVVICGILQQQKRPQTALSCQRLWRQSNPCSRCMASAMRSCYGRKCTSSSFIVQVNRSLILYQMGQISQQLLIHTYPLDVFLLIEQFFFVHRVLWDSIFLV